VGKLLVRLKTDGDGVVVHGLRGRAFLTLPRHFRDATTLSPAHCVNIPQFGEVRMKTIAALFALALYAAPAWTQCHKLTEINTAAPEGQLLQKAGLEEDAAQKLALQEQFAAQYPQHEAAGWVYEQLLAAYVKANEADKALAVGDKLSAMSPQCVEDAQQTLKAAEMKKDPDLILKWSAKTAELAQKVVASPQPTEADEVENWKARVDYARQVNTYTEYSLYAMALGTADPKKQVALIEALQQRNPKSEYLAKADDTLFVAYQKSGATDKAVAFAQQIAATGSPSEDMLLVLTDDAAKKKDAEKVHAYSAKLVEVMNSKPKPEGVADADWTKRKNTILGLAYSMNGKQYFNEGKLAQADAELRKSLPLVDGALKTEVLFYLGLANYKMEKVQDAYNFFKACAAVSSPFQAQANKNLTAIRAQYHGIK
jgi:tetratricopeptide (TPR) repeat protein